MTGLGGTTYIDFGTPDASIVGDGSQILWFNVNQNSYYWTNTVYGLKWGDRSSNPGQEIVYTTPITGLTDTGTSCIIGPKAQIDVIFNEAISKATSLV